MAGSAAFLPSALPVAASPSEEEVASMNHFIENALDLLIKVQHRPLTTVNPGSS
jgi:hypothetical protein